MMCVLIRAVLLPLALVVQLDNLVDANNIGIGEPPTFAIS